MNKRHLAFFAAAFALIGGVAVIAFLPLPRSQVTHIHTETDIDRSPADVFQFVTTPGRWPQWHPSSLAVSGQTDHSLGLGESVTERFRVAGRDGTVTWTVTAREPNRRWEIRGTVEGGGAGVITYTLKAHGSSTRFVRDFDYGFRRPWLIAANALWIRSRVTAESTEALRRLRIVLETPRS